MSKLVIIITTYTTNAFQELMLVDSVKAAQKFYPTAHIVILNDNHSKDIIPIFKTNSICMDNIEIKLTSAPRAGECNAYIWASDNAESYDTFLFIHDSVILKSVIPELKNSTIWNPLWYAESNCTSTGMLGNPQKQIIEELSINGQVGELNFNMIKGAKVLVTFGGMGIWTSEFSQFLRDKTNIKSVFPKCNTRPKRCILERMMSLIFHNVHPTIKKEEFRNYASCGNIFKHGNAFRNKEYNFEIANNNYALKIWQGR